MAPADTDVEKYDLGIVFVHGIGLQKRGDSLVQITDALVKCAALLCCRTDAVIPKAELVSLRLQPERPNAEAWVRFAHDGADPQRWLLSEARWAEAFPESTYSEVAAWALQILPATLVVHLFKSLARRQLPGGYQPLRPLQLATRAVSGLLLIIVIAALLALILTLAAAPIEFIRGIAASLRRFVQSVIGDSHVLVSSPARRSAIYTSVRDQILHVSERSRAVCVIGHSQGAAIAHQVLAGGAPDNVRLLITFGSGLEKLVDLLELSEIRVQLRPDVPGTYQFTDGKTVEDRKAEKKRTNAIQRKHDLRSSVPGLVWLATATLLLAGALIFSLGLNGILVTLGQLAAASTVAPLFMFGVRGKKGIGRLLDYVVLSAKRAVVSLPWLGFAVWFPGWFLGRFDAVTSLLTVAFSLTFVRLAVLSNRFMSRVVNLRGAKFRYGLRDGIRWFDYFATKDPVPNGALLVGPEPADWRLHAAPTGWVVSFKIHNRNSVWGDHTTYWKNIDEFVSQVLITLFYVSNLVRESTLQGLTMSLHDTVSHARASRVHAREIVRHCLFVVVVAASAVYWAFAQDAPPLWLKNLSSWLSLQTGVAVGRVTTPGWLAQTVIVVIGGIAYFATATIWNAWDHDATDKRLRGWPNDDRLGNAFNLSSVGIVIAAVLLLGGAFLVT